MDQKLKTIVCIIADITFTIAAIILAYSAGYTRAKEQYQTNNYDTAKIVTPVNKEGENNFNQIIEVMQEEPFSYFKDYSGRSVVTNKYHFINMWTPYTKSYVKNFTVTVYSNEEVVLDDIVISYYDSQFNKLGELEVNDCIVIADSEIVVDNGYTYQKVIQFTNYMDNVQVRATFSEDIYIEGTTLVVNDPEFGLTN